LFFASLLFHVFVFCEASKKRHRRITFLGKPTWYI
jgi:hypothetical protein